MAARANAAAALVQQASAAGVRLEARPGGLWADQPGRLPPELRASLAQNRRGVLRLLREGAAPCPAALPAAPGPLPTPPRYRRMPPSWADPSIHPTPGAACSCCHGRAWWTEAQNPQGWRCRTCYPPDHLPANAVKGACT